MSMSPGKKSIAKIVWRIAEFEILREALGVRGQKNIYTRRIEIFQYNSIVCSGAAFLAAPGVSFRPDGVPGRRGVSAGGGRRWSRRDLPALRAGRKGGGCLAPAWLTAHVIGGRLPERVVAVECRGAISLARLPFRPHGFNGKALTERR